MAGYIGSKASVVSNGAERKKVFDITTTTTSLTGCSYTPNQVHVFHNGVRLVDGTDYTATDGSTVTLTTAAQSGDEVVVVSYATFQPADAYTKTESDGRFVNVTGDTMSGRLVAKDTVSADTSYPFGIQNGSQEPWYLRSLTTSNTFAIHRNALGDVIRLDASGRVTMPYQPYFHASLSANVNITTNNQVIAFDYVESNIGSHYNASNYRFTAPVSGRYLFSVGVRWNYPASSGYTRFTLRRNGSNTADNLKIVDPINTFSEISYQNSSQVAILNVTANDYFEVIEYSNNTGGQLAGNECHFIGYLLG